MLNIIDKFFILSPVIFQFVVKLPTQFYLLSLSKQFYMYTIQCDYKWFQSMWLNLSRYIGNMSHVFVFAVDNKIFNVTRVVESHAIGRANWTLTYECYTKCYCLNKIVYIFYVTFYSNVIYILFSLADLTNIIWSNHLVTFKILLTWVRIIYGQWSWYSTGYREIKNIILQSSVQCWNISWIFLM